MYILRKYIIEAKSMLTLIKDIALKFSVVIDLLHLLKVYSDRIFCYG